MNKIEISLQDLFGSDVSLETVGLKTGISTDEVSSPGARCRLTLHCALPIIGIPGKTCCPSTNGLF